MSESENDIVTPENEEQVDKEQLSDEVALNTTVEIETLSACERKIVITVPHEEIDRYFSKEFDEIIENANVPGFRKGRAPKKLVAKRYRKTVADRVKSTLIMDGIQQLGDRDDITPISEPDFDFAAIVLPEEGPMVFEFRLEVRPEFDLPNWEGLKIEKPVRDFTPDDVDRALDRVLTDYGQLVPKETAAENGDYIVTKLTFLHGGKELSSANEETIRIRPTLTFHDGSIENFDKLMIGVQAGDVREVEATLSQDALNPDYRGVTVIAKFEILDVKKLKLPELTPAFLKQLGSYNNVGELKDAVKDALERQLDYEQRRRTRQQVTDLLTVSASWELPPAMLERQSQRELQRVVMELQRSGYTDEMIKPQINFLRQNSRATTAQALKEHFILEKIAEAEDIEALESDYDTEIMLIAAQQGETPRRIRAQLEKRNEMDILRNQIIERKVLDLIFSKATFTETPYAMEGITEEGIDHAAAGGDSEIPEASEEDLRAANREAAEKRELGLTTRDS
ncbi:MAG: trigger factor [Planctomycetaceae bacterium]|nr:trigger factor [Planctomycetaceae bacterium]